jgi:hypothetical protein
MPALRRIRSVKPPLTEARGLHAQPLGHSDPAVLRPSLGLSTLANSQPYIIPSLAVIGMVFFQATRSDAKSEVRKGKALPARRFESVRRHSQERLRTPPSFAAWTASRRLSKTKRARKAE